MPSSTNIAPLVTLLVDCLEQVKARDDQKAFDKLAELLTAVVGPDPQSLLNFLFAGGDLKHVTQVDSTNSQVSLNITEISMSALGVKKNIVVNRTLEYSKADFAVQAQKIRTVLGL